MVLSASRLVVIYLFGNMGAPAAAEMYAYEPTFAAAAVFARMIAESLFMSSYVIWPSFSPGSMLSASIGFLFEPIFVAEKARWRPAMGETWPETTPL
jgi:hypothetical protein